MCHFSIFAHYSQNYKDEIRNIVSDAGNCIEEAGHNWFAHPISCSAMWAWPYEILYNCSNYSDFRGTFNYLFWWNDNQYSELECDRKRSVEECQSKLSSIRTSQSRNYWEAQLEKFQTDFDSYLSRHSSAKTHLQNGMDIVQARFSILYSNYSYLDDPHNYYQKGLIYFDQGNVVDAIDLIKKLIEMGKIQEVLDKVDLSFDDLQLALAKGFIETCDYKQAALILSQIIEKDAKNGTHIYPLRPKGLK
ncbi:MAG: hypothetical protein P4L16_08125 [Chlamydiales bacterium]|nr:hypothetical protein [Chlamydiales bacterium]